VLTVWQLNPLVVIQETVQVFSPVIIEWTIEVYPLFQTASILLEAAKALSEETLIKQAGLGIYVAYKFVFRD